MNQQEITPYLKIAQGSTSNLTKMNYSVIEAIVWGQFILAIFINIIS
jgi:hypothetical protein